MHSPVFPESARQKTKKVNFDGPGGDMGWDRRGLNLPTLPDLHTTHPPHGSPIPRRSVLRVIRVGERKNKPERLTLTTEIHMYVHTPPHRKDDAFRSRFFFWSVLDIASQRPETYTRTLEAKYVRLHMKKAPLTASYLPPPYAQL